MYFGVIRAKTDVQTRFALATRSSGPQEQLPAIEAAGALLIEYSRRELLLQDPLFKVEFLVEQ
jgi:hypothetical protein